MRNTLSGSLKIMHTQNINFSGDSLRGGEAPHTTLYPHITPNSPYVTDFHTRYILYKYIPRQNTPYPPTQFFTVNTPPPYQYTVHYRLYNTDCPLHSILLTWAPSAPHTTQFFTVNTPPPYQYTVYY